MTTPPARDESPAPTVTGEDAAPTPEAETPAETAAERPKRRWRPRRRPATDTGADDAPASPSPDATEHAVTDPSAAPEAEPAADEAAPAPVAAARSPRRLRRDRRRLITRREEAVYHLGGLAFELYRRDLLGEEVMRARAGEVAQIDDTVRDIDVRLGEIDRDRRERRRGEPADPSAGCCLTCRAPFRAEARFCWQCGAQLVPPSMGDEQVTAVIVARPPS
jgi:hypothetical protein